MANDKIAEVGVNIAEKATMIWNVADMLGGRSSPHVGAGRSRLPGNSGP
ncbi:MAG: hypothetical protein LUH42_00340 [Oscillospiraceae bacterium]|nr:hypothetical protein [Oscillospiraceae bacterium]